MKWEGQRESDNVEDLRDQGGGGGGSGFGGFGVRHIGIGETAAFECFQDRFRVVAEADAEMVDEVEIVGLIDAREQGELGEGRPAMDEGATGIVAYAAEHRGADAGGANDGMRLPPQGTHPLFEVV